MGISPPIPETAVGVTESTWIAAAGDISWGGGRWQGLGLERSLGS